MSESEPKSIVDGTHDLGEFAETSLRNMRSKFRLDVAGLGGPVGWIRARAPELERGIVPSISEQEFFANFEEDYVDGSKRLTECLRCPKTGGECAGGYRPGQFPQWHETELRWEPCGEKWYKYQLGQLAAKCGVAPTMVHETPGPGWDLGVIGEWTRAVVSGNAAPWLILRSNEVSSLAKACASVTRRMCHYWGPGTRYPPAWHRSVPALESKIAAQLDAGFDPFESDDVVNAGVAVLLDWEPDIDRKVQRAFDRLLYKRYSNGRPHAVIATTADVKVLTSRFRQCAEFSGSSVIVVREREL